MEGIDRIVARVWPGRTYTLEELTGGITSRNVLVTLDRGERFVLRLGRPDAEILGIDRRVEAQAALAAAAVGVGPPVETFLESEQCLVTRYVEGEPVTVEQLRDPAILRRLVVALRAFHNGPPLSRRFSSFEVVEAYRTTVFGRGAAMPSAYVWARQVARRIQAVRGAAPERPCHNDLVHRNVIDDGARIRLLDWEYAGMGDVFFDLANLSVNNGFGDAEHEALLTAYFGRVHEGDLRALHLMRFMSDYREAMWGVLQSVVSTLDVDFAAYAAERFARLETIADDKGFRAALG